MPQKIVVNRLITGEPVQAGGVTITPVTRVTTVQIPGWLGGLTWNRPAGVKVQAAGQPEAYLPVRDLTRRVLWALLGAALASFVLSLLLRRRRA